MLARSNGSRSRFLGALAGFCATTLMAGCNSEAGKPGSLSVRLRLPDPRSPKRHRLSVELTNNSDRPMRIWETWNSWGYETIALRVRGRDAKTGAGAHFRITPKPRDFTMNYPSFSVLKPGESATEPIDLDNGFWDIAPESLDQFSGELEIRAEYASTRTPESDQNGVFVGFVESDWVRSVPLQPWLRGAKDKPVLPTLALQLSEPRSARPGHFFVEVSNPSAFPTRLWYEITFAVRQDDSENALRFRIKPKPGDPSPFGPSCYGLKGGDSFKMRIDLDDGSWEVPAGIFDHPKRSWEVRAEHASAPTLESDKYGVFVGSAQSGWVRSEPPHPWLKAWKGKEAAGAASR